MPARSEKFVGTTYAVIAFLFWGGMPAYWRLLKQVTAPELLSHRILWSLVFVAGMLAYRRRLPELWATLRDWRRTRVLLLTAALIGVNWGLFIWAVNHDLVLQSSLGYFINPLANVLLGAVVLKERLRPLQIAAVSLATLGVLVLTVSTGGVPWIALALALTFALYGLFRKTAAVDALLGLSLESLLLAPLALAFLVWMELRGEAAFLRQGPEVDALLVLAGPMTALPLLWFAHAARRLELSTVGVLQYLSPTCQFLLAVLAYGEEFTPRHLFSFSLIWAALALYTLEGVRSYRAARRAVAAVTRP